MESIACVSASVSLFLSQIPEHPSIAPLSCQARNREIENTRHPVAKAQKYYVWRLLEEAIEQSYGISPDRLTFQKQPGGRWEITGEEPPIFFSLSHCDGAVAVALSRTPVGVDIEPCDRTLKAELADKVLTTEEKQVYDALLATERSDYLLRAWVAKESLYKRTGQGTFCPNHLNAASENVTIQTVTLQDRMFLVALASNAPDSVSLSAQSIL
jgi:phosphopantetheine--protein transferase-like protein